MSPESFIKAARAAGVRVELVDLDQWHRGVSVWANPTDRDTAGTVWFVGPHGDWVERPRYA